MLKTAFVGLLLVIGALTLASWLGCGLLGTLGLIAVAIVLATKVGGK